MRKAAGGAFFCAGGTCRALGAKWPGGGASKGWAGPAVQREAGRQATMAPLGPCWGRPLEMLMPA